MKCRTLLACLLCVCALSALWLVSCTMNGSIGAITQWTISGTAQYTGTPTAFVTLGAFYYQKGSGTPASRRRSATSSIWAPSSAPQQTSH